MLHRGKYIISPPDTSPVVLANIIKKPAIFEWVTR
jgi:hypothetical protein